MKRLTIFELIFVMNENIRIVTTRLSKSRFKRIQPFTQTSLGISTSPYVHFVKRLQKKVYLL